ncbi:hypothetical protein TSA6c_17075 [Azospirillum sp. TSA6c]|uniref:hypothetical protein n=1 Tax=Azospirillum sp. TSA6c TaxID=709813 RepID=UPI000D61DED9|nr:hypothetical protein [Azospirillum sp. TSA6c]PWC48147.1 hypothetical protein TSA6c_17075 [Azospirillum sp. TSA6c]
MLDRAAAMIREQARQIADQEAEIKRLTAERDDAREGEQEEIASADAVRSQFEKDAAALHVACHDRDEWKARATKAEMLCAEAVRAARLLHFANGDCDPQFGKALAWLSKIALGNSFTELEMRSPAGPLENATHARERAEGALQAVTQALEEIQMIASGAIGPNCGAGPDLIRIAGQAENALDTIRRLASVPPMANSDAAGGG